MGGCSDGPRDEVDTVYGPRRAEERASRPAREPMFLNREPACRELALQDLTNLLMIGSTHEPRDGELAE